MWTKTLTLLLVLTALAGGACAQDDGATTLSAARKRAAEARGLRGAERDAILEDALRILRTIPERFPDEKAAVARAWLEAGRLEARLRRPKEAITCYERTLQHPSEQKLCCDALHGLATAHRKQKRLPESIAALARLVEEFPAQGPSRARALVRLGGLHRQAGDPKAAAEAWRRCLKEHGDLWRPSVDALDRLVGLEIQALRVEKARELLEGHREALRQRFAGTRFEASLERALGKMRCVRRLEPKGQDG